MKQQLLSILKEIREIVNTKGAMGLPAPTQGICDQLLIMASTNNLCIIGLNSVFYSFVNRWPHSSNRSFFPVPDLSGRSASDAYIYYSNYPEQMWEKDKSKYAAMRLDLLDFIINELEKELGEFK
jgi:hypothetical protein